MKTFIIKQGAGAFKLASLKNLKILTKALVAISFGCIITSCGNGSNANSQANGAKTLNQLQQYVSMLQYESSENKTSGVKKFQSAIGYQQSFSIESTETLSSVSIKYYNDSICNNLVNQHDLNGPATLPPGTYTSSDQSNYALCSAYPNGCSGLISAVTSSAYGWSMKYVYNFSNGASTSGACMDNPANPIGKSAEFIANYANGVPVACTLGSSCGYSTQYSTVPISSSFAISSLTPIDGSTNFGLNQLYIIVFNNAVDPTTIGDSSGNNAGNIWLQDQIGNKIELGYVCAPTICNDAYTTWIAPAFSVYLIPGSIYQLMFNESQIKDTSGNSLGAGVRAVSTFTTLNSQPIFSGLASGYNSMAVDSAGSPYMWGWYNSARKFGSPATLNTSLKFDPQTLVSTYQTTCAKSTTDGQTYCWGSDSYHALGRGIIKPYEENTMSPIIPVWGNHNFKSLAAGTNFACGIDSDGVAWCWGENNCGQMGFANPDNSCTTYPPSHDGGWGIATPGIVPDQAILGITFQSIYAGGLSVCAISTESNTYCWGKGVGASGGYSVSPVLIGGDHQFKKLAMYNNVAVGTCGLDYDGKLWCWSSSTSLPVQQVTPNDVSLTDFAMGNSHICALDALGNMYCQGSNGNGQYGNGNTSASETFVNSASGIQFKVLSTGINYTCGVTLLDNLTYCWGLNNWGSAGGQPTTSSASVLVPALVYGSF